MTLHWPAWVEGVDVGDPPIIEYLIYVGDSCWTKTEHSGESMLTANLTELHIDTDYAISIATVREGPGGIGPTVPAIDVATHCGSKHA